MSYYYTYYLAYKDKNDGLVYPFGPFNKEGKLASILCKSRSFASDLHERFRYLKPELISDSLYKAVLPDESLKECEYQTQPYSEEEIAEHIRIFGQRPKERELKTMRQAMEDYVQFKYLPLSALPSGSLFKEGYVLSSQVDNDEEDFYPVLTPSTYAERLKAAVALGAAYNCKRVDYDSGKEYYCEEDDISKYVYHKWVDIKSEEYEAYMISYMADVFEAYGEDIFIIETEG